MTFLNFVGTTFANTDRASRAVSESACDDDEIKADEDENKDKDSGQEFNMKNYFFSPSDIEMRCFRVQFTNAT